MAQQATFADLQNLYAQLRGEFQNGSIVGMNDDEKSLMKRYINEEIRELADLHPPFLNSEWHIIFQTSVTLISSASTPTVTATANVPEAVDTEATLKYRDVYGLMSDGEFRRRVIGVSGTTIQLETGFRDAATTGDTFKVYKETYPLPHDLGDIEAIFFEDGEKPIYHCKSRAEFVGMSKREITTSIPTVACDNIFTEKWGKYKFQETSVTVTNGARNVKVGDSRKFGMGDIVTLTTGTTVSLHTLSGVGATATSTIYLDRNYGGSTGGVTLECNPVKYVNYLSVFPWPTAEKDVLIRGWIKPQDLVYDDDVSIIPAYFCTAVVVGALIRDKLGLEILSEQLLMFYEKVKTRLKSKTNVTYDDIGDPLNTTGILDSSYGSWPTRS